MQLERLKRMIEESNYIVALLGPGILEECSLPNFQKDDACYDVEATYGYSPTELLSAQFYETRKELFFQYYKDIILKEGKPCQSLYSLAHLENTGKLKTIITTNMYNIEEDAGCKNVIHLYGYVDNNKCPRCGRSYSVSYIKDSATVPLCEKCQAAIRPQIFLIGELLDNGLITHAANEIEKADMLLLLGTHINDYQMGKLIQYYTGNRLVVINDIVHCADSNADLLIKEQSSDVLPKVVS